MELRLTINDKEKSYKKIMETNPLVGKKLGQEFDGKLIEFEGYTFKITGGSDKSGFPMRSDIQGDMRRKALVGSGIGVHLKRKGMKIRKSFAGNTVNENISQINLLIIKKGSKSIENILGIKPEEEKPAEKPLESKQEIDNSKEKPQEKEIVKEESKPEEKKENVTKTEKKSSEETKQKD